MGYFICNKYLNIIYNFKLNKNKNEDIYIPDINISFI